MAIRPTGFNPDGSVGVLHDDATGGAHSGTVTAAQIAFANQGTGAQHTSIVLPCPVVGCGAVIVLPIGGGPAAAKVQELFVRVIARVGCPCGGVATGAPLVLAQAHVKMLAQRIDGPSRWAVQGQLT